jgi:hypothetical protein
MVPPGTPHAMFTSSELCVLLYLRNYVIQPPKMPTCSAATCPPHMPWPGCWPSTIDVATK